MTNVLERIAIFLFDSGALMIECGHFVLDLEKLSQEQMEELSDLIYWQIWLVLKDVKYIISLQKNISEVYLKKPEKYHFAGVVTLENEVFTFHPPLSLNEPRSVIVVDAFLLNAKKLNDLTEILRLNGLRVVADFGIIDFRCGEENCHQNMRSYCLFSLKELLDLYLETRRIDNRAHHDIIKRST